MILRSILEHDDDTNHVDAEQRRRDAGPRPRRISSSPEETSAAVETAIADGYRLIDTAASYDNEREVGAAIRASGIDRGELFITTKLWFSDYGYDQAFVGFEGCLRRLGLDYIDLFLLHQPVPTDFDATVAAYEAIEKVLSERRARAIGVSNFSEQHLENLMQRTEVVPAVNQVELHPFFTQQPLREFHAKRGIKTEAWSRSAESTAIAPLIRTRS